MLAGRGAIIAIKVQSAGGGVSYISGSSDLMDWFRESFWLWVLDANQFPLLQPILQACSVAFSDIL